MLLTIDLEASRRFFAWLFAATDRLLVEVGLPVPWRDEILAGFAASLLLAAGAAFWKLAGRGFRRLRGRRPGRAGAAVPPEAAAERAYLRWLALRMRNVAPVWLGLPDAGAPPLIPVPTPARRSKLRRLDRFRLQTRDAFVQARLFRHNVLDYRRNPVLSDLDLSVRAGFGRRVKIRNLARELRRFSKIVVLGDPGSGKSVCLRQLARDLAEEALRREEAPRTLPLFLEMGGYDGWADAAARKPLPVLEFIRRSLLEERSIREAPASHPLLHVTGRLEDLLSQGRVTLIFDALDEMPQGSYQERYAELRAFMEVWEPAGNRFVYSCRSLDYDPAFTVDEVIIDPFDRARIRAFLELNAPEVADALYRRIEEDESLAEIVANPFFLQALVFINQPAGGAAAAPPQIPESRGQLVSLFASRLIERETGVKQSDRLEAIEDGPARLRRFLSELAFTLQTRREGGTSVRTGDLGEVWERHPDWRALLQVATRARILGKRVDDAAASPGAAPPERIEFVHHRLEELFAAEELARRFARGAPVEEYMEDIWWQETVILAIGSQEEPRPILERLIAPAPETGAWLLDVAAAAEQPPTELRVTTIRGPRGISSFTTEPARRKLTALLQEIRAEHAGSRAELFDLPVAALGLDRIRQVLEQIREGSEQAAPWVALKRRGEALTRSRTLFIVAEAAGQVPVEKLGELRAQLQRSLGAVVRDGNSLLKVRALRALRFLASPEILPSLEIALYQSSSWVKATALRTLFHLGLREQGARSVLRRIIGRSFRSGLGIPFRLVQEEPQRNTIFQLMRGLLAGLLKERGGSLLALQAAAAGLLVALWTALLAPLLGLLIAAGLASAGVLFFAGLLLAAPTLRHLPRAPQRLSVRGAGEIAFDYTVLGLLFTLAPFPHSFIALGLSAAAALAIAVTEADPIELVRKLPRLGLLLFLAFQAPPGSPPQLGLAGIAALDLLLAVRRDAGRLGPLHRRRGPGDPAFHRARRRGRPGAGAPGWLLRDLPFNEIFRAALLWLFLPGLACLFCGLFVLALLEIGLRQVRGLRAALLSWRLHRAHSVGDHLNHVLAVAADPRSPPASASARSSPSSTSRSPSRR